MESALYSPVLRFCRPAGTGNARGAGREKLNTELETAMDTESDGGQVKKTKSQKKKRIHHRGT